MREMRREILSEKIKKRRNFFFSFVLMILLWFGLAMFVYLIPPRGIKEIIAFFILLFGALFWFFSLLFASSRWGLLISSYLTIVLFLRLVKQVNVLNIILLGIASIGIIIALRRRN